MSKLSLLLLEGVINKQIASLAVIWDSPSNIQKEHMPMEWSEYSYTMHQPQAWKMLLENRWCPQRCSNIDIIFIWWGLGTKHYTLLLNRYRGNIRWDLPWGQYYSMADFNGLLNQCNVQNPESEHHSGVPATTSQYYCKKPSAPPLKQIKKTTPHPPTPKNCFDLQNASAMARIFPGCRTAKDCW